MVTLFVLMIGFFGNSALYQEKMPDMESCQQAAAALHEKLGDSPHQIACVAPGQDT